MFSVECFLAWRLFTGESPSSLFDLWDHFLKQVLPKELIVPIFTESHPNKFLREAILRLEMGASVRRFPVSPANIWRREGCHWKWIKNWQRWMESKSWKKNKEYRFSFNASYLVKKKWKKKAALEFFLYLLRVKIRWEKLAGAPRIGPLQWSLPPSWISGNTTKTNWEKKFTTVSWKGGSVCAFASLCRSIVNKQTLIMFSQRTSKSLSFKPKDLLLVNDQCSYMCKHLFYLWWVLALLACYLILTRRIQLDSCLYSLLSQLRQVRHLKKILFLKIVANHRKGQGHTKLGANTFLEN